VFHHPPSGPPGTAGGMPGRRALAALAIALTGGLTGCLDPGNTPSNLPMTSAAAAYERPAQPIAQPGSTALIVAFSGGGARSAAFGYGVLSALAERPAPGGGGRSLADEIAVVAGVSGGGILAAYLALHGPAAAAAFRQDYLDRDAEAALRSTITPVNLLRGYRGGVNELSGLASWLDDHLYHDATLGDVERAGGPRLLLHATDLYNRAAFPFDRGGFRAICSDYRPFPLSHAVAASAAVPLIFAPVVLQNFAAACPFATRARRARTPASATELHQAASRARYNTRPELRYLKLLDGGLVDNLAVRHLMRTMREPAPAPLRAETASRIRRVVVLVVDASMRIGGTMSLTAEGPRAPALLTASIDAMIDGASRASLDLLRYEIRTWRQRLIGWRCATAPKRGCDELGIDLIRLSLADIDDPETANRILALHNRLSLQADDVDFLAALGRRMLVANPVYRRIARAQPSRPSASAGEGPPAR